MFPTILRNFEISAHVLKVVIGIPPTTQMQNVEFQLSYRHGQWRHCHSVTYVINRRGNFKIAARNKSDHDQLGVLPGSAQPTARARWSGF
jgi:hypothetical protein